MASKYKKFINNTKSQFWLWVGSLLVFDFLVFAANGNFYTASSLLGLLLLTDIGFGVVIFLLMVASSIKLRDWSFLGYSTLVCLLFFGQLFLLPNVDSVSSNQIADNEIIDCPLHQNCGGDYKRLTYNECTNSTCCQIGNVWVVKDTDECKLAQQEYELNSQPPQVVVQQPAPQYNATSIQAPEAPLCCRENCNSFTGTCTTRCDRSWICI